MLRANQADCAFGSLPEIRGTVEYYAMSVAWTRNIRERLGWLILEYFSVSIYWVKCMQNDIM